MKITAQEEYGLRCLLQLARREPPQQLLAVKDIAEKEGLSGAYAEKLLRLLAKGGLVHSVRGAKGGYQINRAPDQITLGEVMRALGTIETTEHICDTFKGTKEECVHFSDCGIRSVWSGLTTFIQRFMDETTLADALGTEYVVSVRLAKGLDEVREAMKTQKMTG